MIEAFGPLCNTRRSTVPWRRSIYVDIRLGHDEVLLLVTVFHWVRLTKIINPAYNMNAWTGTQVPQSDCPASHRSLYIIEGIRLEENTYGYYNSAFISIFSPTQRFQVSDLQNVSSAREAQCSSVCYSLIDQPTISCSSCCWSGCRSTWPKCFHWFNWRDPCRSHQQDEVVSCFVFWYSSVCVSLNPF